MQATPDGQLLLQAPQLDVSLRDRSHPFSLRPSQSPNPSMHPTSEHTPASEHAALAFGNAHCAHGPASIGMSIGAERSSASPWGAGVSGGVSRSSVGLTSLGASIVPASGARHMQTTPPPTHSSTPRVTPGPMRHPQGCPAVAQGLSIGTSAGGGVGGSEPQAIKTMATKAGRSTAGGYCLRDRGVTVRPTGTARDPAASARNTPDGTRRELSPGLGPIQLPTRPKGAPVPRASATGRAGSKPCRKSSSTVTIHRPSLPALLLVCSGNP